MRYGLNALVAALAFAVTASVGQCVESSSPRAAQTINRSWTFNYFSDAHRDDAAAGPSFDDSAWPVVALPHTWQTFETSGLLHPFNADASGAPGYWWNGWGWYRKHFNVTAELSGKKVFAEFDGVQKYSLIYLNGKLLGDHKGGYTSFCIDLTDALRFGGDNVLAVAVNNALDDTYAIPPMSAGNFNTYGGIYRDVRLVVKNRVHIPYQGSHLHEGGTFMTTPEVSAERATVRVRTWAKNDDSVPRAIRVRTTILDPYGKSLASEETAAMIAPGETQAFDQSRFVIHQPQLWSPDTPVLYRVASAVFDGAAVADQCESPLGFRWFEWNHQENRAYLNGKPLHIHGTNRHQEYPWLGDAIPKWITERDLNDIRFNLAHNFMRTAHYPNDPAVYDWCDRNGVLICEEVPNIKNRKFSRAVQEQNVREMIRRDRNHPCIVFWCMGNETSNPADSTWAHEEDATRIITARHAEAKRYGPFVTHTDANMDMENLLRCSVRGWSDRDVRDLQPQNGQSAGTEEWQHVMARKLDGSQRGRIDMPNGVMWIYSDHGANRIYSNCPLKYLNPKGWTDAYRVPKYMYYLWQANYLDRPMAFIHPHFWTSRYVGQTKSIVVDSNCDTAELFVNGASRGLQKPTAENFHTVTFEQVKIEPGKLSVICTKGNETVTNAVIMADDPVAVMLSASHGAVEAALDSVAVVTADIVDKAGVHVQGATNAITWSVSGPARLCSPAIYASDIAANGAAEGAMYITAPVCTVIRATGQPGAIVVRAACDGLRSGEVRITATEPPARQALFFEPPLDPADRKPVAKSDAAVRALTGEISGALKPAKKDLRYAENLTAEQYAQAVSRDVCKDNPPADSHCAEFRSMVKAMTAVLLRSHGTLVADDYNFIIASHNRCRQLTAAIAALPLKEQTKATLGSRYAEAIIENGEAIDPAAEIERLRSR